MKRKLFMMAAVLGMLWSITFCAIAAAPQIPIEVWAPGEQCRVELQPLDSSCPMPENRVLEFQNRGAFPKLEFQKPGVYRYRLTQIPGEEPGCIYDRIPYEIQIRVLEQDGELTTVMTAARQGVKTDRLEFHNTHMEDVPKTGDSGNWIIWLGLTLLGGIGAAILCLGAKEK